MTKSLRARLFVGLTAVILLAGCIGGAFTYLWAFDEAIEMQDSTLIQIGSLLQNGSVKSDQSLGGVDADAEVDVTELGMAPHGSAYPWVPVSGSACTRCCSRSAKRCALNRST